MTQSINITYKKPSEAVKAFGLNSMVEFSELTQESERNLFNWFKSYPRRFELLLKAVVQEKALSETKSDTE